MLSISLRVLNIEVPGEKSPPNGTSILVKVSNIVAPGANNGLAKIPTNTAYLLEQVVSNIVAAGANDGLSKNTTNITH